MRIGLVYDRFGDAPPPPGAPPDWDAEYEPEATIAALEAAVRRLGHEPVRLGNVPALLARMAAGQLGVDAAVSIAESYGSRNREAHAPVLLELAGVPCLFSDALALSLSLDKALTKTVIRAAGIRTPEWQTLAPGEALALPCPVFVKPRYEGTAKGIAPTSRCATPEAAAVEIARQHALYGPDLIAEAFVDGAEFTVGVIGTGATARALPVLQRAVEATTGIGLHALERHEASDAPFAYRLDGALTPDLEAALQRDAVAAHRALGLADVSRSDFRVDGDGQPWFLEVNPLPTFAPDGTFAILAELAGVPYAEFLADLLAEGLARLGLAAPPAKTVWTHERALHRRVESRMNDALPTCTACGHDRYHHAARADLKYGAGSWLALFNGVSGTPREMSFRCAVCNETFETTRDPAVLKQFRRYPYVMRDR